MFNCFIIPVKITFSLLLTFRNIMKRLIQLIMLHIDRVLWRHPAHLVPCWRVKSTKEAHNARPASLDACWHAAAVAAHACLGRSAAKAIAFNRICAHTTPRSRRAGAARDTGDNRLPVLRYLPVVADDLRSARAVCEFGCDG